MATVFNNLRMIRPSFSPPSSDHSQFGGIYADPRRDWHAKNEMGDLLEYVAVAAGLKSDWAVTGDAIGNGHPNKSLKPKLGFAHRIHCGAAGIKGVARQSLSAWRGGPPTYLEWRSARAGLLARTCARIDLNEVRNENPIRCDRCSGR
jgi:hypothetical protein